MSKREQIRLVDPADPSGEPPYGTVRRTAEVPVFDESVRINVDVPDRRARLVDVVPLARAVCGRIVEASAARSESAGKPVSCAKGCSACCAVPLLGMSEPEAFSLVEDMKRLSAGDRNRILNGFVELGELAEKTGLYEAVAEGDDQADPLHGFDVYRAWWRQVRRDCPILRHGACSMYPSRPMACREFLVTSDPDLCQASRETRVDIPFRMYHVLARLSDELEGRPPLRNFVLLPLLLRWYGGQATRAQRTWRGPMLVERFLAILSEMAAQAAAPEAGISVSFR